MTVQIGHPRAFLQLLTALALLGAGVGLGLFRLDHWLVLAWLALLAAGSALAVARAWRHRDRADAYFPTSVSALPERWRRWVTGESGLPGRK